MFTLDVWVCILGVFTLDVFEFTLDVFPLDVFEFTLDVFEFILDVWLSGSVWVLQHQQQFQRFTSASFMRRLVAHLRGQELLSVVEEMRVEDGGGRPVEEQVMTLLSLLASKAPQGPDALQAFVENSDSHEARLILNHGTAFSNHPACRM